ncbi:MAG: hypothetical protein JNL11_18735 [Bdellovibrionaceae bacterium]|nr:hypothetical protein [Pseudobdellovibrionaceae bacterium]
MPSIKDFDKDKKKKKNGKKSHDINVKAKPSEELDVAPELEVEPISATDILPQKEKRRPSHNLGSHRETLEKTSGQIGADMAEGSGESKQDEMDFSETNASRRASFEGDDKEPSPESFQSFSEPSKFELRFPGSFLIKEKAPKAFDLVERVAGDWVNDGTFESLPVGHPLAQLLAAKTLTKAKSIEKNVLNSTPVALAKIGLEYAKSKIKR